MRFVLWAAALVFAGCTGSSAPSTEPPAPVPQPSRSKPAPTLSVSPAPTVYTSASAEPVPPPDPVAEKARVLAEYAGKKPRAWGVDIAGVHTMVTSKEPSLALTFDACGGPGGDGYDSELIVFLRRERVSATLFLTNKWIKAHPTIAASLAADPLFEIENHGSAHRPCSVTGRSAFDIRGTRNASEAVDEMTNGALAVFALTKQKPRFYRPGTAYFDDVCLQIANALGYEAAGFAVNGDGGTGFSRAQVKTALLKARPGSIVLLHMNHPSGATAEGVMDAVPVLRERGIKFVRLGDPNPK